MRKTCVQRMKKLRAAGNRLERSSSVSSEEGLNGEEIVSKDKDKDIKKQRRKSAAANLSNIVRRASSKKLANPENYAPLSPKIEQVDRDAKAEEPIVEKDSDQSGPEQAEADPDHQEPEVTILDDGTDYGDAVFNVPNIPRVILMLSDAHHYHIKAGTLYKLVERLTEPLDKYHKEYEQYMKMFFMTYRSFAEPEEVLELIIRRFHGPPGLSPTECEELSIPLSVIKSGTCRSLVYWFNNHYRDFTKNPKLQKRLSEFVAEAEQSSNVQAEEKKLVTYLSKMIQKKEGKGTFTSLWDCGIMVDIEHCPEPIVPKSWDGITFLDLDELEIARQLSISEHHVYAEIQPVELQELAWSKDKLKYRAPNVLEMIQRFNKFSNAVSVMVTAPPKLKLRKKAIEKLVRIAEHLLEMNSFNMVMAILSGFQNAATHRLHHSFGAVAKKTQESIDNLNQLMSSQNSYKAYRDTLNQVKPPAIPFLGVYLSDLTFVDEGNPKMIGELYNFRKRQLEYDIIIQVLRFQDSAYQFKLIPKFSSIINALPNMTDSELYAASLANEPRKAKKKDIK